MAASSGQGVTSHGAPPSRDVVRAISLRDYNTRDYWTDFTARNSIDSNVERFDALKVRSGYGRQHIDGRMRLI
jgi:hypothetical protein